MGTYLTSFNAYVLTQYSRLIKYGNKDVLVYGLLDLVDDSGAQLAQVFAGGTNGGAGGAEVAHQVNEPHRLAVGQGVPVRHHHLCGGEGGLMVSRKG